MLKQPCHRYFGITVARSQQRFLASNSREAHRFKLSHRGGVELSRRGWYQTCPRFNA